MPPRNQKMLGSLPQANKELAYRRQFLIGPRSFQPTEEWKIYPLSQNLVLSSHPELGVIKYSNKDLSVILIGYLVDSFHPSWSSSEILNRLAEKVSGIVDLIDLSYPLSGRWVLIFQDPKETCLFSDPSSFRQIFYYHNRHGPWAGSQPEIIKAATGLRLSDNKKLWQFVNTPEFVQQESAWIGDKTIYQGCHHLLPNWYLALNSNKAIRFFPNNRLSRKPQAEIVKTATTILRGSLIAMAKRMPLALPITAGWDSRILLAASRDLSGDIEYYIDRMGILPENHPDIRIPKILTSKLGLNFDIKNSYLDPPGWFVDRLTANVSSARVLPKTRMIYSKYLNRESGVNITGNGGEIARNFFDKKGRLSSDQIAPEDLPSFFGYKNIDYVEQELEKWVEEIMVSGISNYHILDLLYWEQRMGNWCTQYLAENDIAGEKFSPFNCRLLITTLLSAPRELRVAPHYLLYQDLIREMWPEVLSVPFNPQSFKKRLRTYLPVSIVNILKKF